jgi:hypothetical protein
VPGKGWSWPGRRGADEWLEMIRTPRSELWREAAAAVLLDEQWTRPGPDDDPVAYFKKRLRRAVGQWRWSRERRLNRRFVGLLSEPRYRDWRTRWSPGWTSRPVRWTRWR